MENPHIPIAAVALTIILEDDHPVVVTETVLVSFQYYFSTFQRVDPIPDGHIQCIGGQIPFVVVRREHLHRLPLCEASGSFFCNGLLDFRCPHFVEAKALIERQIWLGMQLLKIHYIVQQRFGLIVLPVVQFQPGAGNTQRQQIRQNVA